jgi:hypothetical protein
MVATQQPEIIDRQGKDIFLKQFANGGVDISSLGRI